MDIKKIVKRNAEKKAVVITLRITKTQSEWLKKKNYSPNGIFQEALKDLQQSEKK